MYCKAFVTVRKVKISDKGALLYKWQFCKENKNCFSLADQLVKRMAAISNENIAKAFFQ